MGEEELMIAGGGNLDDMPQQQAIVIQPEVTVVQPPPDHTLAWTAGVVVPLLVAGIGVWLHFRKKKD